MPWPSSPEHDTTLGRGSTVTQQTAFDEQQAAAARKALPIEARRQAARVMFTESVAAGMPMTAGELGEAFGRSVRWGRDRMNEVRDDLAETAETAVPAVSPEGTGDAAGSSSGPVSEPAETAAEETEAETQGAQDTEPEPIVVIEESWNAPAATSPAVPATDPSRVESIRQHLRIR